MTSASGAQDLSPMSDQRHRGDNTAATSGDTVYVTELPRSGGTRVHALDTEADEPLPACGNEGYRSPDREWVQKELTGGLAAFRIPCQSPECNERLRQLAADKGITFDG